ncbi:MAG TPA: hypothetical protein VFA93_02090 [Patescibacteria group bacterium]|nr:hypothetical protein [Patescibacteria group bacterium]
MDEPAEIRNSIKEPSVEEKRELTSKAVRKTTKEIIEFKGNSQEALVLAHKFASYIADDMLLISDDTFQLSRFPKELYGKGEEVSEEEWKWASTEDVDKKFRGFHNPLERGKSEAAVFDAQQGNYQKLKEFLEFESRDNWGEKNKGMNEKLIEIAKIIADQGSPIAPLKPAWLDQEIIDYKEDAA